MSVIFRIYGDQETVTWLHSLAEGVRKAVIEEMQDSASVVSEYIKEDLLNGTVLNRKTGKLAASIYARVYVAKNTITLSVGSRGDVPYAMIHEWGGTTSPHQILPIRGTHLAFAGREGTVFARMVNHPGSVMPERSYLRRGLREKEFEISFAIGERVRAQLEELNAS